jgi:hypothetical protein
MGWFDTLSQQGNTSAGDWRKHTPDTFYNQNKTYTLKKPVYQNTEVPAAFSFLKGLENQVGGGILQATVPEHIKNDPHSFENIKLAGLKETQPQVGVNSVLKTPLQNIIGDTPKSGWWDKYATSSYEPPNFELDWKVPELDPYAEYNPLDKGDFWGDLHNLNNSSNAKVDPPTSPGFLDSLGNFFVGEDGGGGLLGGLGEYKHGIEAAMGLGQGVFNIIQGNRQTGIAKGFLDLQKQELANKRVDYNNRTGARNATLASMGSSHRNDYLA